MDRHQPKPKAMSKRCPVKDCPSEILDSNDMCFKHWRMVPEDLAADVRLARADDERHMRALRRAIGAVENQEGK